ncbi:MAG: 30S ribosome-binding factor RbfA [Gemmatimonadaceae bacterium]
MRNTRRADRVSEAIREVVATFLAEGGGAKDPRITGLVTVTGVDITSDLRHAKVFVSVLGTESEKAATFDGLQSVAGHLRSQIAKTLQLRVAPQIAFKVDESVAHAARIESLLEQIKNETPARDDGPASAEDAGPPTSNDEERQP